jgi:hypothetical protein
MGCVARSQGTQYIGPRRGIVRITDTIVPGQTDPTLAIVREDQPILSGHFVVDYVLCQ